MRQNTAPIDELSLPLGFYGYLVRLEAYPVAGLARERYVAALHTLSQQFARGPGLHWTMALQCDELYRDGAIQKVSRNAGQWRPSVGMGVYPDQPPPATWTADTLLDREYSEETPPLKHTVIQIQGSDQGKLDAMAQMGGTGGLLQAFSLRSSAEVLTGWNDTLLRMIVDESFRAYPLYMPLLNEASLRKSSEYHNIWDELFRDCQVYLRESFEDKALLVMTRAPEIEVLMEFAAALQ